MTMRITSWDTGAEWRRVAASSNMALEMAYATGLHRAALFATGVLTLGLALGVSLLAARGLRSASSLPAGALRA